MCQCSFYDGHKHTHIHTIYTQHTQHTQHTHTQTIHYCISWYVSQRVTTYMRHEDFVETTRRRFGYVCIRDPQESVDTGAKNDDNIPRSTSNRMRQVATATDSTPEACDRKLRLLRSIRETSDNNRIWDIRRDATPVIGTPEAHKSSVN